jgi:hypothetical protein
MTRDLMRLIDQRADWHLANWARWMRTCEVGIGYPHASAWLSSGGLVSGDDSFDHMQTKPIGRRQRLPTRR